MCVLPLLAGQNVSAGFVVPTVATSVDLVVQLVTDHRGRRRVSEILGVTGRVEGEVIEASELFLSVDGRLTQGGGYPPHEQRYVQAGFDLSPIGVLAVLLIFVLAQIFHRGAQMRAELEGTV